jgi:hypothetical protein
MKALGTTLFAIVLTMSPVVIVNAQTAAQPTTTTDVATKSDLRQATAGLSKELKKNASELKKEIARQAKAQADAQAAEKAAGDKRDAELKDSARQAKAQADATRTRDLIIGVIIAFVALLAIGTFVIVTRDRKTRRAIQASAGSAVIAIPAKCPTPEDLYGQYPGSDQVRKCLHDNKLEEGRFTIDLPIDGVVFEYRAVVMPDGNVMAYFAGNEKPVSLEPQKLRKIAKALWGQDKLIAVELKHTDICHVS